MNALVIYESLTGNTRYAAGRIAEALQAQGVASTVCNVTAVDLSALAAADLVVVGSWTDGIVIAGQRPGRAARLAKLPYMVGKKCAVFCTYAINPGRTIDKMARILEARGAEVIGGMAIRRTALDAGSADFVARVLNAVKV
jgi:flavorubredoxin